MFLFQVGEFVLKRKENKRLKSGKLKNDHLVVLDHKDFTVLKLKPAIIEAKFIDAFRCNENPGLELKIETVVP